MKKCALLGIETELCQSHIIPKFFYKYLKNDAGNHPFYSVSGQHQDGYKIQLLCKDAEDILSKYERYFQKKIFTPIVRNKEICVEYDFNLKKFIVSLLWRCLLDYGITVEKRGLDINSLNFTKPILENWKQYLLDKTFDTYGNFYIFPITEKWLDNNNIPCKYHRAFLCDISWNFYVNENTVSFYAVVPNFIFISIIRADESLFHNSKEVENIGSITTSITPDVNLLKMLLFIGRKVEKGCCKVFKNKNDIQRILESDSKYLESELCRIYKKSIIK